MKIQAPLFILLIPLMFCQQTTAQFKIGGESRTRTFVNYGYKHLPVKGDIPAIYVEQRTRINFFYANKKVQFYFSGQDNRVWGQDQFTGSNSLGINEAWINILLSKNVNLKLGRQNVGYDNGRMISDADWNNWGNSFDISLLQFRNKTLSLSTDFALGINNRNASNFESNYDVDFYKYLSYLWINKTFLDEKINISWMNIVNAVQKQDEISYHSDTLVTISGDKYVINQSLVKSYPGILYVNYTTGIFLNINFLKHLYYEGEIYYQGGKTITGNRLEAFLWSSWINGKLGKWSAGIGYQHASGTNLSKIKPSTRKSNTFNYNMYGNEGDPFFGDMSYFIHPASSNSAGITDLTGSLKYAPSEDISINVFIHMLGLAQNYITPATRVENYLGTEFDFTVDWHIAQDLDFEFCYGFMLPGNSLRKIQQVPTNDKQFAQYCKIQIEYTPWFFMQ